MSLVKEPRVLLPNNIDMQKWAVIACDQFTSQMEYWDSVYKFVGPSPSTVFLTLPEVFLNMSNADDRISDIHNNMGYYADNLLSEVDSGIIIIERQLSNGKVRQGVIVAVDLEEYDYRVGSKPKIRPTEETVEDRIPARLRVRDGALLELSHIMLLIDDPHKNIIEPMFENTGGLRKLYDFDLMQDSGNIRAYLLQDKAHIANFLCKINSLSDISKFNDRYSLDSDGDNVISIAVGDGNHSMATAKTFWSGIRENLSEEERENHPARYVLAEIGNIHSDSLEIEPIHRVLFKTDLNLFVSHAKQFYGNFGCDVKIYDYDIDSIAGKFIFCIVADDTKTFLVVDKGNWNLSITSMQDCIDKFIEDNAGSTVDYIHDLAATIKLSKRGNIGFIFPKISKSDIFTHVMKHGVFPRKAFSMGESVDKRFYIESRKIK